MNKLPEVDTRAGQAPKQPPASCVGNSTVYKWQAPGLALSSPCFRDCVDKSLHSSIWWEPCFAHINTANSEDSWQLVVMSECLSAGIVAAVLFRPLRKRYTYSHSETQVIKACDMTFQCNLQLKQFAHATNALPCLVVLLCLLCSKTWQSLVFWQQALVQAQLHFHCPPRSTAAPTLGATWLHLLFTKIVVYTTQN